MAYTKEEQEIFDKSGIHSYEELNKDSFPEYASALSNTEILDPETMSNILKNTVNICCETINKTLNTIDESLKSSSEESKIILESYRSRLEVLNSELLDPNLSDERRAQNINETSDIFDKMDNRKDKDDAFRGMVIKSIFGGVAIVAVSVTAVLIGKGIDVEPNDLIQ